MTPKLNKEEVVSTKSAASTAPAGTFPEMPVDPKLEKEETFLSPKEIPRTKFKFVPLNVKDFPGIKVGIVLLL
jgi:hypothetical protein|tara:strand:- start:287 stop:505 length:219 start_codon:yes stop_codon:yes gene_type:complete